MRDSSLGTTVLVGLWVAACTTIPPDWQESAITPEELLAAAPLVGDRKISPLPDGGVLKPSAEMLAFLDRYVTRHGSDYFKLQQLIHAVIRDDTFRISYDDTTRTAAETFQAQHGNCLSFTNMFVAMARHVGLDARFQEVDVPPDWTFEGDTFVLNRHVNIYVDLARDGDQIVDFNIDDYRATYDRRLVTDERALAHYYNNIGVRHLQNRDAVQALANFRKALEYDAQFGPAWGNLGALYRRQGYPDFAEAAYQKALRTNPQDQVAMSNLSRLYAHQGNTERATWYREQVTGHRMRNPYYRYHLARQAFLDGDFQIAISNLKYALRRKESEDSFYFLLGLSYLQLGDHDKARRWMAKAEELATGDALKRNYRSKIDMLLRSNEK